VTWSSFEKENEADGELKLGPSKEIFKRFVCVCEARTFEAPLMKYLHSHRIGKPFLEQYLYSKTGD
jgi:hypothetical protein